MDEDNPKFKIRDKVTAVLNPNFLGQITGIVQHSFGKVYIISYFKEGEPMTTNMYGFEIELVAENGSIGFN